MWITIVIITTFIAPSFTIRTSSLPSFTEGNLFQTSLLSRSTRFCPISLIGDGRLKLFAIDSGHPEHIKITGSQITCTVCKLQNRIP